MKGNKLIYLLALTSTCAFALAGCDNGNEEQKEFDFSISLKSGKTSLEIGDTDQIEILTNGVDDQDRTYTFDSSNPDRASVSDTGYVTTSEKGFVTLIVTEEKSQLEKSIEITIDDVSVLANGGFNYSAASGEEAIEARTEILGKLEKYAVESHLTGITLFENGGYVKYNKRLEIPAKEYITGYGFGILSEGDINADLEKESIAEYKRYYHSAQTSNPNTINAWNATGSQVSDLSSYITSTYWGNKMNENKDGYDWYPVLAADTVDGKANNRPFPVYETENPLGLYKTWRIYVKTGSNAGLKYRYSGTRNKASFDNRPVALADYATVFKLLLTGANKQTRGAEMAGDKTYGIKGAQAYYTRTKDLTNQEQIDNVWKEMTLSTAGSQDPTKFNDQQLGIMVGSDEKGDFLQLELINEIDKFTAMYTLSSSLYSPIPEDFIKGLAADGTVISGILNYGRNGNNGNIVDNTISLGAYKLDVWEDAYIAFGQNDTWVERTTYPNRNKIKGVKINTYKGAEQDPDYLYKLFYEGYLDSCGIPISHISEEASQPDVRTTKGDSTFKLNVNSCTQERWNELFGPNGTINKGSSWQVKPWMSNENFLNGLYWSINREQFAKNRGVQPSINYFADAYLTDPENGVSYNDSNAHKAAVAKWHTVRDVDGKKEDDYGYSYDKAVQCFKTAVMQLVQSGAISYGKDSSHPTVIQIHIRWMYQTDINDYGSEIAKYFEDAFNDPAVSGGTVKLEVKQDAVTNWEDVYNEWMMKGQFDLAFGAISGNTYNPLNFLEVLKSDNSSGFTLNWGPDTSKVDEKNPLIFDGKKWSFDALWEVSDRGGVVENGVAVKTVKNYYFDGLAKNLNGQETGDFSDGATWDVALEFVDLEGVEINVDRVEIYTIGSGNTAISSFDYDKANKKLHCRLDKNLANSLKAEMVELNNKGKNPGDEGYVANPFQRTHYNTYWDLEIYYSLSIQGGTPSQSYVTVAASQADQAK